MSHFAKHFQQNILEEYQSNGISKLEMAEVFSKSSQDDFIADMNHFRSAMKGAFDTPMRTALADAVREMKSRYIAILEDFDRGKYYYGAKVNLRQKGRAMQIWRIPVRIFNIKFL